MSKKGDFEAVRKDIVKLLHQPEYDDDSAGPVLVRLAWYVSDPNVSRIARYPFWQRIATPH
jgi:catalase (peroxidase I)